MGRSDQQISEQQYFDNPHVMLHRAATLGPVVIRSSGFLHKHRDVPVAAIIPASLLLRLGDDVLDRIFGTAPSPAADVSP